MLLLLLLSFGINFGPSADSAYLMMRETCDGVLRRLREVARDRMICLCAARFAGAIVTRVRGDV